MEGSSQHGELLSSEPLLALRSEATAIEGPEAGPTHAVHAQQEAPEHDMQQHNAELRDLPAGAGAGTVGQQETQDVPAHPSPQATALHAEQGASVPAAAPPVVQPPSLAPPPRETEQPATVTHTLANESPAAVAEATMPDATQESKEGTAVQAAPQQEQENTQAGAKDPKQRAALPPAAAPSRTRRRASAPKASAGPANARGTPCVVCKRYYSEEARTEDRPGGLMVLW